MAGSYEQVTTPSGNLRGNESFVHMIENLGDAYEAVEEMYGMIWWLAATNRYYDPRATKKAIEDAQENYKEGLRLSKVMNRHGG